MSGHARCKLGLGTDLRAEHFLMNVAILENGSGDCLPSTSLSGHGLLGKKELDGSLNISSGSSPIVGADTVFKGR